MLSRAAVALDAQDEMLRALQQNPTDEVATTTGADRAMLDYAMKLTRTPAAMTAADVAALRSAGFDARAIHDICTIVGYFAFVNRLADGLGVDLEDHFGS